MDSDFTKGNIWSNLPNQTNHNMLKDITNKPLHCAVQ